MLLTRPPLTLMEQAPSLFVRLACIRHAASVRPEPGSNSHERLFEFLTHLSTSYGFLYWLTPVSRIYLFGVFISSNEPVLQVWCCLCSVFNELRCLKRQLLYTIIEDIVCQEVF